MRMWLLAGALLLVPVAVPTAASHATPDPPEWMTRLLHDYNDDWGGDDGQGIARHGHDIMSLDLQEAYNASLGGDVLVFRLALNAGFNGATARPELKEVLTFTAKGQPVSREFRTSDNQKFQGTFDSISAPVPLRKSDGTADGTRFYVEGTLRLTSLGISRGDKINGFFVQGYAGTEKADHMVGGYSVGGQARDEQPPSEVADPASYRRQDYTLRGPVMYAHSRPDTTSFKIALGQNKTVAWEITNPFGTTQKFIVTASKHQDLAVAFHGQEYSRDLLRFDLGPGLSTIVHVYVTASNGASSTPVTLTLSTSLGGRNEHQLDVQVVSAGTSSTSAARSESTGGGSPDVGALIALSCLALAAGVFRRLAR